MWGKHYIVWDKVDSAVKYNVYHSEKKKSSIGEMKLVTSLSDTKFEYEYDKDSPELVKEYFAIEAECDDGKKYAIDSVQEIVVWPEDAIIYIILLSLAIWLWARLVRINR